MIIHRQVGVGDVGVSYLKECGDVADSSDSDDNTGGEVWSYS